MRREIEEKIKFFCSKDGMLEREDVDVWCNSCYKEEQIYKDGMYLCPKCFTKDTQNFRCRICGREVKMEDKTK